MPFKERSEGFSPAAVGSDLSPPPRRLLERYIDGKGSDSRRAVRLSQGSQASSAVPDFSGVLLRRRDRAGRSRSCTGMNSPSIGAVFAPSRLPSTILRRASCFSHFPISDRWYEPLKEHTFETVFIDLSVDDCRAMLAYQTRLLDLGLLSGR